MGQINKEITLLLELLAHHVIYIITQHMFKEV